MSLQTIDAYLIEYARRQIALSGVLQLPSDTGNGLTDDRQLLETVNLLPLEVTSLQYRQLLSSAIDGAIWQYPENWHSVVWPLFDAARNVIETGGANCYTFPASNGAFEYIYNNPYTTPLDEPVTGMGRWSTWQDVVDWVVPLWIQDLSSTLGDISGLRLDSGYQDNDAMFLPLDPLDASIPFSPQWFYDLVDAVYNFDVPRVKFDVIGSGSMEIELLAQPFGGVCVVVVDRPFSLLTFFGEWLNGDITTLPGVHITETNREITQLPPNTDATVDLDLTISGTGSKSIEIMYLPRFDVAGGILGYGGGLRGVQVCDGLQFYIASTGETWTENRVGRTQDGVLKASEPELNTLVGQTQIIRDLDSNQRTIDTGLKASYGTLSDIYDKTNPDNGNTIEILTWKRLQTETQADNMQSIDIDLLPGYDAVRFIIRASSDAAFPDEVRMYFNGDATLTNYRWVAIGGSGTGQQDNRIARIDPIYNLRGFTLETTIYNYDVAIPHDGIVSSSSHKIDASPASYGLLRAWTYTPFAAINRVQFIGSTDTINQYEIHVEYLVTETVSVVGSYGTKADAPGDIKDTGLPQEITDMLTFNPADGGTFVTNFGTVLPSLGNPDYHLYLYQAGGQPVPFSLDCTYTLPSLREVTAVEFDYMVWDNDVVGDVPVTVRIKLLDAADNLLQQIDYIDPAAPQLTWQRAREEISQTNVAKVELVWFGYQNGTTHEYELRLDNIEIFSIE